ncbi:hypothetical protein [Streptomyces sp. TR06-5]|uniref:hypothetical protein n=1 Tax=unclassified Streptomyces TaxID=2593676 RepID=UPI00399FEC76
MGALLRMELLTELLARVAVDLLSALDGQGTALVLTAGFLLRLLHRRGDEPDRQPPRAPAPGTPGVGLACVATVLLALVLLGGIG